MSKVYKTTARQRENAKKWREQNPERFAELLQRWRAKRLGVEPGDVARMLKQQNGCAICHISTPRGKNTWHVDHNHKTGRVRGVLCITCNIALGMLHDDPDRARAAAYYLELDRLFS